MERTVTGMDKYKSPYNGCVFPTDYVPRQAIIEAMYHYQRPLTEKEVNAIPAADVRENVKGEWIQHYETTSDNETLPYGWECSLCGRWEMEKQPFCNCGAQMGGAEDG